MNISFGSHSSSHYTEEPTKQQAHFQIEDILKLSFQQRQTHVDPGVRYPRCWHGPRPPWQEPAPHPSLGSTLVLWPCTATQLSAQLHTAQQRAFRCLICFYCRAETCLNFLLSNETLQKDIGGHVE